MFPIVQTKCSYIPPDYNTFKNKIKRTLKYYNKPCIVILDFDFVSNEFTVIRDSISAKDILKTHFSKPTFFYSSILDQLEIPFNIHDKEQYEKCIQLYHELSTFLRYYEPPLLDTICKNFLGISLQSFRTIDKNIENTVRQLTLVTRFIEYVHQDHILNEYHRRLKQIAKQVREEVLHENPD